MLKSKIHIKVNKYKKKQKKPITTVQLLSQKVG